jgi:glycosyltransferase involved in cell wall biosynthesis
MNLLAVTSQPPWPPDTGGHLRTFSLLRALARRFDVRLVTGSATPVPLDALRAAGIDVRLVPLPRRTRWSDALGASRAVLRRRPYVLYARHDHAALRAALHDAVAASPPDVLYLDHLDSWVYADVAPGAARLADLHNVYSLLAGREAGASFGPRRAYLRHESRLLAGVERVCAREAEVVTTVSAEEARHYQGLGARAVHVVPNGVDCHRYASLPTGRLNGAPTLLYIGTMSWQPNVSAARFLAERVLPQVRLSIPDARLLVVGRDPLPAVRALDRIPGVTVAGGVPDVIPYLEQAHLLAVPLDSGGGTRLKILEAFAAGLPVVSTRIGAEGIAADDGTHLVLAERQDFSRAVADLLSDSARGQRIAAAARRLALERYDWDVVGTQSIRAVEAALSIRAGTQ